MNASIFDQAPTSTEVVEAPAVEEAKADKPEKAPKEKKEPAGAFADTIKGSLALDRTVLHVETGDTYGNCFRIHKAGLLTNGQSDRLSGILYSHAKKGEKVQYSFGEGLTFELVNV